MVTCKLRFEFLFLGVLVFSYSYEKGLPTARFCTTTVNFYFKKYEEGIDASKCRIITILPEIGPVEEISRMKFNQNCQVTIYENIFFDASRI